MKRRPKPKAELSWRKAIEIKLDGIETEVVVVAKYTWSNDGIGPYEYWGAKCYDYGNDYTEVEDIVPDFDDKDAPIPLDKREAVAKHIEENYDAISESIAINIAENYEEDDDDEDRLSDI